MIIKRNKEILAKINELLEDNNILRDLCNYSNNILQEVISNLAIVINYYLVTGNINCSIEEILTNNTKFCYDTNYIATNTIFKNKIIMYGLNSKCIVNSKLQMAVSKLSEKLGRNKPSFTFSMYNDLEYAIFLAIRQLPLFDMLMDEKGEVGFKVGESQISYYTRVYEDKLRRKKLLIDSIDKDMLGILINSFIDGNPCIIVTNNPWINRGNVIRLPSLFQIINMCAKNKGYNCGEEINPLTMAPINEQPILEEERKIDVTYNRYERITVDDNFKYSNEELTGDAKVDLRIIYGREGAHNTKNVLERSYLENIALIRERNNIFLYLRNGLYRISNGRHRIVYMKYFYDINHWYYMEDKNEEFLKLFTIPVNVNHKIEDKEFNDIIQELYKIDKKVRVFKNDIKNDEIVVGITIKDKLYFINGIDDLKELVSLIKDSNYNNRFLYVEYHEVEGIEYNRIIERLYEHKGDSLALLSFKELLNLMPREIVKIINPYLLYSYFVIFVNNYLRNKLFNTNFDLIQKNNYEDDVVNNLLLYLYDNPSLCELDIETLINKLEENNYFKCIDENMLRKIICLFGLRNENSINEKSYKINEKKIDI